jgi:hypothetical protein
MKILNLPILLVSLCVVAGCSRPVPVDKASYIGEWSEKTMYLLITKDGTVKYKREKGNGTTSVNAPIKGFSGDNFDVGVGPMATTFVVSKAPYQDGDKWKMVVDGIELVKTAD